ncbi:hypothetical protein HVE01_06770 [Vreelandella venusta]|nr:hypothetical protein HVE01_06770 [Halomonas venusta]
MPESIRFSKQKKAPFNEWREDRKLWTVYLVYRPKSNARGGLHKNSAKNKRDAP